MSYSRQRQDQSDLSQNSDMIYLIHSIDKTANDPMNWFQADPIVYPEKVYSTGAYQYRSMVDTVTPNFRNKIAAGEIINSPMSSSRTEYFDSLANLRYVDEKYKPVASNSNGDVFPSCYAGKRWFGTYPSSKLLGPSNSTDFLDPPTIDASHLKSLAITQAYANVDISDAQGLMMLAEGEKTVASLVSIAKRAARLMRIYNKIVRMKYLSQKDIKWAKKQFSKDELLNRYMEVRYSLRPLLYDARDCVTALSGKKRNTRFTFRGYEHDEAEVSGTPYYTGNKYQYAYIYAKKKSKLSVIVRAGVMCEIESADALNTWGFDQPIETLWEVIPFSFVADWFFNIGSTIASWTPEMGVSQKASWCTVETNSLRMKSFDHATVTQPAYDYYRTCEISECEVGKTIRTVVRTIDDQRSIWPKFRLRLDALKLLDLGIIMKNLCPGKKGNGTNLSRKMY